MNHNEMTEIYHICKLAMKCIVSNNYEPLRKKTRLQEYPKAILSAVLE